MNFPNMSMLQYRPNSILRFKSMFWEIGILAAGLAQFARVKGIGFLHESSPASWVNSRGLRVYSGSAGG